jgi:hypothetical protein
LIDASASRRLTALSIAVVSTVVVTVMIAACVAAPGSMARASPQSSAST